MLNPGRCFIPKCTRNNVLIPVLIDVTDTNTFRNKLSRNDNFLEFYRLFYLNILMRKQREISVKKGN